MKKISQGKYEVYTTKADAIDKFMQMQGACREKIGEDNPIQFYCSKRGRLSITNPPRRYIENTNSTSLFARVIEQDGKTYVSYYTVFNRFINALKVISLTLTIAMAVLAIALNVANLVKTFSTLGLILCVGFFVFRLLNTANEKQSAPKDSEIMVKELEKRVEAVNHWDK